jgi:cell division FtsZ-interacting protein ZapD
MGDLNELLDDLQSESTLNELLDALSTEDSLSELLDTLPDGEGRPNLIKPGREPNGT